MVMGDQFGCCFVPGRPTYIWGGVSFGMTRETFDRLVYKTTLESSLVKTSVSGAGLQHVHRTAEWGRELRTLASLAPRLRCFDSI